MTSEAHSIHNQKTHYQQLCILHAHDFGCSEDVFQRTFGKHRYAIINIINNIITE